MPTARRHFDERSLVRLAFRLSAARPAGRGGPGTLALFAWVGPRSLGIEPERPGWGSCAGLLSHSRRTSNHRAESSDTVSPDRGAKIPASCAPAAARAAGPPPHCKHGLAIRKATVRLVDQTQSSLENWAAPANIRCIGPGRSSSRLLLRDLFLQGALHVQMIGPRLHHLSARFQVKRVIVGGACVVSLLVREL